MGARDPLPRVRSGDRASCLLTGGGDFAEETVDDGSRVIGPDLFCELRSTNRQSTAASLFTAGIDGSQSLDKSGKHGLGNNLFMDEIGSYCHSFLLNPTYRTHQRESPECQGERKLTEDCDNAHDDPDLHEMMKRSSTPNTLVDQVRVGNVRSPAHGAHENPQ